MSTPSLCACSIVQTLCTWTFILIIKFHFIPISIMSHPIEHMWSSTITTPLTQLPYLFTHSPAPALTFLTYPCKTISLTQGGQHPLLHPPCPPGHVCIVGCAIHALCILTPFPPSVCIGTPQLSLSVLRDGKMVHPQQVQPLLVDCVPTLTCSGALCALEHASVVTRSASEGCTCCGCTALPSLNMKRESGSVHACLGIHPTCTCVGGSEAWDPI